MNFRFDSFSDPSSISKISLEEIINLDKLEFGQPWSDAGWNEFILSRTFCLISLKSENDELMGFVLWEINYGDSFAHLLKILIQKKFRGLKYSKILFKQSFDSLQIGGVKKFFLEVEEENTIATNLYSGLGFKTIHTNKHFYGQNQHAKIMTLVIL